MLRSAYQTMDQGFESRRKIFWLEKLAVDAGVARVCPACGVLASDAPSADSLPGATLAFVRKRWVAGIGPYGKLWESKDALQRHFCEFVGELRHRSCRCHLRDERGRSTPQQSG